MLFIYLFFLKYPFELAFFISLLLLGRGDILQLFISPYLKYEEWLYNITCDKNFEINSLEPPVQGSEDYTYPHRDL